MGALCKEPECSRNPFASRLPTPGLCAPSRSCSHTDALAQTTLPPFDVIATHESVPLLTVRLQMVWDNLSCLGTEALARLD